MYIHIHTYVYTTSAQPNPPETYLSYDDDAASSACASAVSLGQTLAAARALGHSL
jgi:hypothetical protein